MDPTHLGRWLYIGKQALALLSKAMGDSLVRSAVADATHFGTNHREQHSIDLVVVSRLALHEAMRLSVRIKEVGRSELRNSASDAASSFDIERTRHTLGMSFARHRV